jgi:hypothetical protein
MLLRDMIQLLQSAITGKRPLTGQDCMEKLYLEGELRESPHMRAINQRQEQAEHEGVPTFFPPRIPAKVPAPSGSV